MVLNSYVKQNSIMPAVASLDIHDETIYIMLMDTATGEIHIDCNILGGYPAVLKALQRFPQLKSRMIILFEAGGHGYFPYRFFEKAGYRCKMIAPHSIPNQNRQKTDRIDTIENIKDFLAGKFRFVTPPSEEIVQARDVLRGRFRVVKQIVKKKQYIGAFTKRYGHFYTGKTRWTKEYYTWLNAIELSSTSRILLGLELEDLAGMESHLKRIEAALEQFFAEHEQYVTLREQYQLIRGFGNVCSMILVLEGADLARFSHPRKLMSFTGLVPGLASSGQSNPHLAITKTGNRYLRYGFVCAAKIYADHRNLYSHKELEKYPPPLRDFLLSCQQRLHNRIRTMVRHGKHINKARCAAARELCGYVWEFVVKVLPQLQEYKQAA